VATTTHSYDTTRLRQIWDTQISPETWISPSVFPRVSGYVTRKQCKGRSSRFRVQTADRLGSRITQVGFPFWFSEMHRYAEGRRRGPNGLDDGWEMESEPPSCERFSQLCVGNQRSTSEANEFRWRMEEWE
jgi:hypothetical protein